MTKPLSDAQAEFIRSNGERGSARGLTVRGLVGYRWGCDPSFGYVIFPSALTALANYDAKKVAA